MILYSFIFENGFIFELQYDNLPKSAPKSEKYQWFFINVKHIVKLEFESMTGSIRKFKDGSWLHIKDDSSDDKFCYNNKVYPITPCSEKQNEIISEYIIPKST